MEDDNSIPRFNKRKAEGKFKSDKSKNSQSKFRKLNPSSTTCYVQILGTGMDTQDTSPSILLFFDKQRFIFNAGEGLQRFCTEHRIKLSKIDHIFLSRVCSETAGGLPGLLLTLAGMGDEGMSVNLWGPSDLKYLVDAMTTFIPKAALVHTHAFGLTPNSDEIPISNPGSFKDPIVLIEDEVVKLSAILLQPYYSTGSQPNLLNYQQKSTENVLKPGEFSVIYICELPEIKGKFNRNEAVKLGVNPGPKFGQLQRGKSVMSDLKNIMVHPHDVMESSLPGPIIFIVDCPTEAHLEELLSLQSLSCYYAIPSINKQEGSKTVNCIIHLSPGSVTSMANYKKWMERFGATKHIMAGHDRKNVEIPILKSSARIAARLNYLCPQFFPAPGFWSAQHPSNSSPVSFAISEVPEIYEIVPAQNLLKFNLRPHSLHGLDTSCVLPLTTRSEIIDELESEIPEIVEAAREVRQLWHCTDETKKEITTHVQDNEAIVEDPRFDRNTLPSCLENITREDMEIVLLGTGSSQPSKYRNVTAIFINLFAKGSLLLDCGEGTLGQLRRRYGLNGADDAVRGLKCIWISHIHADHHGGVATILSHRQKLLKESHPKPLLVIGPKQLEKSLIGEQLEDCEKLRKNLNMVFLDCRDTLEASNEDTSLFVKCDRMERVSKRPNSPSKNDGVASILKDMDIMLYEAGLESLVSFPVVHCPDAFGVSVQAAERVNNVGKIIPGWKIVYSGDTRPCPELIEAAHGATVLIHEATFEDALIDEAIARNHSTIQEAIDVGESAGTYRIILTHFSQRYPKIPVFDERHMDKTCIAFDLMSVNLADLHVVPKILPYLRLLFKKDIPADEPEDDVNATSEEPV